MTVLIFLLMSSIVSPSDMLPEIEITAPRYSEQENDSIGTIPEVVVYGEKYAPQSVNKLVRTYFNYRSHYQQLFNIILNYGVLIIAAIFIMTLIIIVLIKGNHRWHAFIPRHEKESQLHQWVCKHHDPRYGNWRN